MPKVIVRKRFTTAKKATKKNNNFGDKVDYILRENSIEKNKEFWEQGYLIREDVLLSREKFFDYSHTAEDVLYYDKFGGVENGAVGRRLEIKDNFNKAQENGSSLHETVISFEKEFVDKNIRGKSQKEVFGIIDKSVKEFLVQSGFGEKLDNGEYDLSAVEYVISFHTNTNNFHFHLDFVEVAKKRKKDYINPKNVDQLKKNIIKSIDPESQKRETNLLILKEQCFSKLMSVIKNVNINEPLELKSNVRYFNSIKSNIDKKNVLEYGYSKIIESPEYEDYMKALNKVDNFYRDKYGSSEKRSYMKSEIKNNLETQLGNNIIQKNNELKEKLMECDNEKIHK